jgi:hypothetical protein
MFSSLRLHATAGVCVLFFVVMTTSSRAQEYPVQVTTMLRPPYTLYLSDYAAPESNAIQINILLRDLDRVDYKIKFRLTIEGRGIKLTTKPSFNPRPIFLNGGIPERLTGFDIQEYFHPNNLDFSGISRQEFIRTGMLREGHYTFKIEVLDYTRGTVVSNPGFANAWMILNDPPMINLPFNNSKVTITDPQNIVFNWTPRHTGSPNAAFSTEYEFVMVELYPSNRNPNDAILSSIPIFSTTTTLTTFIYSIAEPTLIPGRKYAFRIRAYDTGNRDLFKNRGYSETYVFQFGDACAVPAGINGQVLDDKRIKLNWQEAHGHSSYKIQLRKKGGDWNAEDSYSNSIIIPSLKPATTYEYRVAARCVVVDSDYSSIGTVTTAAQKTDTMRCGIPPATFEVKTSPLEAPLQVDDLIKTADFEITLTSITLNPDGSYKGEGFAAIPWFNLASVKVKFHNIRVNEDYRVYSGNVTTIYNKASRSVWKIDLDKQQPNAAQPNANILQVSDTIKIDNEIRTVSLDTATKVLTIVLADGTTKIETIAKDEKTNQFVPTLIQDSAGNSWIVDKNGNVMQGPSSAPPATVSKPQDIDYTVTFSKSPDQLYGFDSETENYGDYDSETIQDDDYVIAWKSVPTGGNDKVVATTGKQTFPTGIGFKINEAEVPSKASGSSKEVFMTGVSAGVAEKLSAYVKVADEENADTTELEIGKLNVVAYNKIVNRVVLVPINNAPLPDRTMLTSKLNEIFRQAVAEWTVQYAPNFDYDKTQLENFDSEEADIFSAFPEKMKMLNRTYANSNFLDNETYYVFVITGTGSQREGFMPFKRKFGYVFADNTNDPIKTLAHELAHGAFRLRHTFSSQAYKAAQGTTNNLMDYADGSELKKYQWDLVHDTENLVSWLEEGEESAAYDCPFWFSQDCETVGKLLELIKSQVERGEAVRINGRPSSQAELTGKGLSLDQQEFQRITLVNLVEDGKSVGFDPKLFEEFNEQFLTSDGRADHQRGFIYRSKPRNFDNPFAPLDPIIFKILIYENEGEINEKLGALKAYLFGAQNNTSRSDSPSGRRYVIFRSDANIRSKTPPYTLINPQAYLEMGREIQIVSHLVEGNAGRILVKYLDDSTKYCTWTGNVKEIFEVRDDQQYKLRSDASPILLPYSKEELHEITTDVVLTVTHECGIYKLVIGDGEQLGWIKTTNLKRYIDNSNLGKDEFSRKFAAATSKAVETIVKDWEAEQAACNLCVRAALLNLTGDDVLFPTVGSSLTILDTGEQIYGKVESLDGSAQGIVDDLTDGTLDKYFDELDMNNGETFGQFWTRLQQMVDNDKAIIIGTYDPGHVFMLVPGGLHEVVDNSAREKSGVNSSDPHVELGDKWGASYLRRAQDHVLRIMDCGAGVKFANGPMYGVMDAGAVMGERKDRIVKFFRYKTK